MDLKNLSAETIKKIRTLTPDSDIKDPVLRSIVDSLPPEFWRAKLAWECQSLNGGFKRFVEHFWPIVEPGHKLIHGEAMDAIMMHLEAVARGDFQNLLVNVPPGFSKSLLTSVFFPAWLWGPLNRPTTRFMCFSYSDALTKRDNLRFLAILRSEDYREFWGDRVQLEKEGELKISNKETGWKIATTIGGMGTGERGDYLICFPPETKILTDCGQMKIGDIVENHRNVKIASLGSNGLEWKRITKWQRNKFRPMVKIHVDGRSFECTEDHRIYTSRGILCAKDIQRGDSLFSATSEGLSELLQSVPRKHWSYKIKNFLLSKMQKRIRSSDCRRKKQQTMRCVWEDKIGELLEGKVVTNVERSERILPCTYNITVEDNHNYFAEGFLVKNCDDILNGADSESKATRENCIRWFNEVMPSRLNDFETASKIVIMQRLHEEDVSGEIIRRDLNYEFLMIPMEYDPDRHCQTSIWEDWRTEPGECAWPERFSPRIIADLKKQLGPYAWASQYQQSPSPRGGGIIKSDWWQLWDEDYAQRLGIYDPSTDDSLPFPPMDFKVAFLDTAFKKEESNDYNALAVVGVWRDENDMPKLMLMECWRKRITLHGTSPERLPGETATDYLRRTKKDWGLVEWVVHTCRRFKVNTLLIENSAKGQPVAEEIERLFDGELFGVEFMNAVNDKVTYAHSVVPSFSGGEVFAPDRQWSQDAIDEVASFPKVAHDDRTDAIVRCIWYLRHTGWALHKDEKERIVMQSQMIENLEVDNQEPIYDV